MIISSRVPPSFHNYTLIGYLSTRFTYLSRDQWHERIRERRIRCNNEVIRSDTPVATGDILSYDIPDFTEPPADLAYTIVYEDRWLLGINKPANLLVHHKGRSFRSNLIYHLRYMHNPAVPQAGLINRLDRETSGIVLVAKESETLRLMNKLVAGKRIEKEYCAIVQGMVKPSSGDIRLPIGRDPDSKISYRYRIGGEKAKDACTRYTVIKYLKDDYTFVRLLPETGRTHQLRVHMATFGHSILGDKLYGMAEEEFLRWRSDPDACRDTLIFPRQALHCSSVRFTHPRTGETCDIHAPLPEDIATFLQYY